MTPFVHQAYHNSMHSEFEEFSNCRVHSHEICFILFSEAANIATQSKYKFSSCFFFNSFLPRFNLVSFIFFWFNSFILLFYSIFFWFLCSVSQFLMNSFLVAPDCYSIFLTFLRNSGHTTIWFFTFFIIDFECFNRMYIRQLLLYYIYNKLWISEYIYVYNRVIYSSKTYTKWLYLRRKTNQLYNPMKAEMKKKKHRKNQVKIFWMNKFLFIRNA